MPAAGCLTLALVLGFAQPAVTRDPSALYREAARLRKSGDLAGAARVYGQAHELLRARDLDHSNVLDSLLDSVDLSLEAHARRPEVSLLCDAERMLAEYETAVAGRGESPVAEVQERRGRVSSTLAKEGVSCQVAEATPPEPTTTTPAPAGAKGLSPALASKPSTNTAKTGAPEGPLAPAPTSAPLEGRAHAYRIGGYTSLGIAGVGLVLLATGAGLGPAAEGSGAEQAMKGQSADWLQENVVGRGNAANALVVAGAVVATAATATAVALLVTARRKSRTTLRARIEGGGLRF
ncbi:hypothetical protein OV203_45490 [Nannocystis sp. ILAH1]|uniref:hypothetical protein n=1 Tax=unclassified Nannocystis TaxID=2627009 RepID=UPI00227136F7|nr:MULTISPECIES: hypothetical protein [unclassified Nannocystis]MCY0994463.1 hypothetical protein [Nannocystis sp. ILAH1]MCY1063549.1 hypothetical protein [Nannocystis sp. RBIL2]